MSKRRAILLGLAGAAITLCILIVTFRNTDPTYAGRSLSQWLDAPSITSYPEQSLSDQAVAAVEHLGPNSLPTLIRWISYEPSRLKRKLTPFLLKLHSRRLHNFLDEPEHRAWEAEACFAVLGQTASRAAPDLARLAQTSSENRRARRCITSLSYLGAEALPGLVTIATNTNAPLRWYAIGIMVGFGDQARPYATNLISCLQDQDDGVSSGAAIILGGYAVAPDKVIPALVAMTQSTNSLRRVHGARGLAGFGNDAKPAVAQLRGLLLDADPAVRIVATNALEAIALEASSKHRAQ